MGISTFDLFSIGIGPSSSHTVGPMRAARRFLEELRGNGEGLTEVEEIEVELFGSLALTGKGHGTDRAVLMGLEGEEPETIDPTGVDARVLAIEQERRLHLLGEQELGFDPEQHLVFRQRDVLPRHPNGLRFRALGAEGKVVGSKDFYSVGGGFVVAGDEPFDVSLEVDLPYPFENGADLLDICSRNQISIWQVMLANETTWHPEDEVRRRLLEIAEAMQQCIVAGCEREGILPGGLKVKRRAPKLFRELNDLDDETRSDPLHILDWVSLFAIAVNEENAAGGRVVTAPTNGAAGIVPAVLEYYRRFKSEADDEGIVRFLLSAAAIAILCKKNASISGAEVGCQGEVGVACSMAAAGLATVAGGTPEQVENAAEIALEHHLGLTCDPIGGLVQIPCIERNAVGATKAIQAARLALRGDGSHKVSLDDAIRTMRQTGADMQSEYKETSRGGLAVHVIEC